MHQNIQHFMLSYSDNAEVLYWLYIATTFIIMRLNFINFTVNTAGLERSGNPECKIVLLTPTYKMELVMKMHVDILLIHPATKYLYNRLLQA